MPHTPTSTPTSTRRVIGPALLIEASSFQGSNRDAYHAAAQAKQLNREADQNLLRLLMATTMCGFGLLVLALIR